MTETSTGVLTGALALASSALAFVGGFVAQGARTKRKQIASANEALESVIKAMEAQRAEIAEARAEVSSSRKDHQDCLERAHKLDIRLLRVESRVGMPRHDGEDSEQAPAAGVE